ncbi:hypothetical protein [Desulfosporosinus sp.]|uniref:hypothetical protein n=1 Tax=Desulfosporosinus sp. TaxID=157907 RepID=UPI0025BD189B|nr:hypothetical protein [Desulfosporosinus sp.]MBC2726109.1 hypothetical protein [Desulfosporosinus sp.]
MDKHSEQENKLILACQSIPQKLQKDLVTGKEKMIDQMQCLKSRFDLFSCFYSSELATRSMVSLTGLGFIDVLLAGRGQAIKTKRVEEFIKALQQKIELLDNEKVDSVFLESEEWMDLLRKAIDDSTRTRNYNKILAIAGILCGAVTHETDNIADPEDLLQVLSELNTEEAIVLQAIYEHGEGEYCTINGYGMSLIPYLPENYNTRIKFLIKRIEAIGLLSEQTGAIIGYSGGTLSLTTVGKLLLELLSDSNN